MSKLNRRSAILSVTSLALIPGMMAKAADSGSSGPYCADGRDASGAEKYVPCGISQMPDWAVLDLTQLTGMRVIFDSGKIVEISAQEIFKALNSNSKS